ncbi:MAG: TlpA disulfide reductase family protein [Arcicella sp.]|nr:TlpA disulfide reductase family protein [Arcicella sp.]
MKKVVFLSLFIFLNQFINAQTTRWRATVMTDGGELPFGLELQKQAKNTYKVFVLNASERFQTDDAILTGDSLTIPISLFDAQIVAKMSANTLVGIFSKNKGRKSYSQSPFKATLGYGTRFRTNKMAIRGNPQGKWSVNFINPTSGKVSDAVGIFQQKGNIVTGTFLTTTGDYRFMDGNMVGDSLFISTFDGSHTFMLRTKVEGDQMMGKFYGSLKGFSNFEATRNVKAELPDLAKMTYLKEGFDKLSFTFPNENGEQISLSDAKFKGKVTVIQILGSWCPNCMDESNYLAPFYKKNKNKGLEIIGLAYEKTGDDAFFKEKMALLRKRFGVEYPLLKAGLNNSESASESLPMLNKVIGFPTTLILDKKGSIRLTHAGFSGPGTGKYYTDWVNEFESLIEKLLKE